MTLTLTYQPHDLRDILAALCAFELHAVDDALDHEKGESSGDGCPDAPICHRLAIMVDTLIEPGANSPL